MKLSIITVVRNAETTIEETILSVTNQTYQDCEFIIVDGLSTDSTNGIINKYKEKIDVYISEEDKGIYDAMNKGVDLASGEWIYFLGADDVLYSEDSLSNFFSNDFLDAEVVYGDVIFSKSLVRYAGEFTLNKLCSMSPCHQSVFYKRRVLIEYGSFDISYTLQADYVMHIRTFCNGIKWQFFDEIIAIYNEEGASFSKKDKKFRSNNFQIRYDNFSGKIDKSQLSRVFFSSFFIFAMHHPLSVSLYYLKSVFQTIGMRKMINTFFVRTLQIIGGDRKNTSPWK